MDVPKNHPTSHASHLLSSGIDPAKIEAITHKDGPLLVIAGPGSGKTRTLVERIVYLVLEGVELGEHGCKPVKGLCAGDAVYEVRFGQERPAGGTEPAMQTQDCNKAKLAHAQRPKMALVYQFY